MKTILLSALVFCSAFFACQLEARPAHRHHHHHRCCHGSRTRVNVNLGAPVVAVPVAAYTPVQPAYVPVAPAPVVAPVAYVPAPAPVVAYPAGYYCQEYYYQAPAPCYAPAYVAPPAWASIGFSFRL